MARIKKLSGFGKRVIAIILCAAMLAAVFPLSSLVNVMAASEGALDGTVLKIDYDSTDGPGEDIAAWLDEKYSVTASNIGEITGIEISGDLDAAAYQILGYVYNQQVAGSVRLTEVKVKTSALLDGDDIGTYVNALNGVTFDFTLLDGATTINLTKLSGIIVSSVTVEAGVTFTLEDGGPTIDSLIINGGKLDLSALTDINDTTFTELTIEADSSIVFKKSTAVKAVQTFLMAHQISPEGITLTDDAGAFYTQEATPAITIDYVAEKLVGLEPDATYLINDDLCTSDSSGEINIKSEWFNSQLNMIKVGRDAYHMDSDLVSDSIPARPQSPDIGHKNTVGGDDNGVLTGLDDSMEYSSDDGKTWITVEPSVTEIDGLPAGTYKVRIKAVPEKSFCSNPISVTIHAGASADITNVESTPIVWGEETAQAITITNNGIEAAYVDNITISGQGANFFEIEEGSKVINPKASISDWKVKPKASPSNPDEGTYNLTFTLTYHNDGVTPPPSASPFQVFPVEIIKAKLNEKDYKITGHSAVYDQKEHDAIKVEGALETDTISYAETANGPWFDTLKVKDVLDSRMYYAKITREHYEPLIMRAEVDITPATPSIQFEDADEEGVISPIYYNDKGSFQYDATNTTGNGEGGEITYEIVEDQTSEAAGAKIVNHDSSQVTYTGVGEITVRASINANGADTNYETGVTAEYTGLISYIDAPKVEFNPASPSNSSKSYNWYNCPMSISSEGWSVIKTETVPLPGSSGWGNSVSETNAGIYKDYTVSFMDAKGNITDLIKIPDFAIDLTAPTASVAIQDSVWNQIRNMVTFGLWKDLREDKEGSYKLFYQDEQKVVIKADDAFSGVKEVYYAAPVFSKDETPPNTEDGVAAASWEWSKINIKEDQVENVTDIKTIPIGNDEVFNTVIYVKVVDWAGNIAYINSNGLIFDRLVPNADDTSIVVPETETSHVVKGTQRPLYGLAEVNGNGGNVTFDVNVTETSDTVYQSGIQYVSYQVEMKDRDTDEYVIKTEETLLYKYNNTTKPLDSWKTTIDVDARENNANYVKVTVFVTDNAGNKTQGESIIAIDLTAPTVQLSYDNNDVKGKSFDGSRGYFDATRTATVTYTERSENWNQQAAEEAIEILAKDVADADIVNPSYSITWQNELGAVPDEDRHIATIRYASSKDAGKDANYNVNIHYADEAGNQASDPAVAAGTQFPYMFTVDATPASDLKVTFSETVAGPFLETMTFGYYQGKVNVKISARDDVSGIYKFLYSYIKEPCVSSVNAELLDQIVQAVELANSNITFDSAKHEFSTVFSIPKEALVASNQFRGTVSFTAFDRCENSTDTKDPRVVVVDNIKPTGEVTFNAPVREANGISYYDGEITASIRIDEANFYPEDVIVEVNGSRVTPNNWTQSGDTWTSSITLQEEGDYKISVNYTDRSGNAMTAFESNQKTIDKTAPVIDVSGVKHESANNGEAIGFTLTVTDKNLDSADINPQLHAVVRQDGSFVTVPVDLGSVSRSTNGKGESVYTYTITNLEADGYYTLAAAVTDYANHQVTTLNSADAADQTVTTDTVAFSVNRNGSAFSIQSKYKVKDGSDKNYIADITDSPDSNGWYANLDGKYANYEVEVVLTEINVDKVSVDTVSGLTLNDGSKANPITLDAANYKDNEETQQGLGGWYKNTYTLGNENFDHDGNWSLNIVTTDTATNQNVNTKETDGATISFVVDRTMPVITSNVESGQIINATSFDVEINVTDANLIGDSIKVVLDQGKSSKETLEVGKGVTALGNNKYSFTVEGLSRTVDVYAVDKAGNIAVAKDSEGNDLKDADGNNIGYQVTGLTVSTNLFVRWYANTVLFWSSIGGVILLAGVLSLFLFFRRRKRDNA